MGRANRKILPPRVTLPDEWIALGERIDWKVPKILMLVGLPGSGKSTWAKAMSDRYPCQVIGADSIRREMFSDLREANRLGKDAHERVFQEVHRRIRSALANGNSAIADATHLYPHAREPLYKIASEKKVALETVLFQNREDATKRNARRNEEERVPLEAMERMIQAWQNLDLSGPVHVLR